MSEQPSDENESSSDEATTSKISEGKKNKKIGTPSPAPVPIRPRTLGSKVKENDEDGEAGEESQEKVEKKEKPRLKPTGRSFEARGPSSDRDDSDEENESPDEEENEAAEKPTRPGYQPSDRPRASSSIGFFQVRFSLLVVVLLLIVCSLAVGFIAFNNGVKEGKLQAERASQREADPLSPETRARLDAALFDLRNSRAPEALKALTTLQQEKDFPALSHLIALAALQSGEVDLVEKKSYESIRKREKVSDSLALLAVVESQRSSDPSRMKLGNPVQRSQDFLMRAIYADPANPYPRFELATLLRYAGRKDEANSEVKGASLLLNPIDSREIMGITSQIMALEALPVDQLPTASLSSDNPQKLLPAAYVAMRLGDFARAAELLRTAKGVMTFDSFDYLVNDPTLRKFSDQPQLSEFYGN